MEALFIVIININEFNIHIWDFFYMYIAIKQFCFCDTSLRHA